MNFLILALAFAALPQAPPPPQAPPCCDSTPADVGGAKGPVVISHCPCSGPGDCLCTPGDCACPKCEAPVRPGPHNPAAADPDDVSLVVISRSTCEPCKRLETELRAKGAGVPCGVYTDSAAAEAKYGVTEFPTTILLRNGAVVATWVGFGTAEQLSQWRKDALAPHAQPSYPAAAFPAYTPPPMRYAAPAFRGSCPTCNH